jgi:CPA1 family monovalent cation:H+ antiporter
MHEDVTLSIVIMVMGLLFTASVVAIAAGKLRFPFTIALVVIGLFLGWASKGTDLLHFLTAFKLTPGVVLYIFLPVLLFESAFNLDSRSLLKNILPIATLAVPGLLISTALVGFGLHYALSLPLVVALLFGSLISATDPVAVVALFKEMGAPKRLHLLVEGESLFNDGTALVVFKIILGVALAGAFTQDAAYRGAVDFVLVVSGGIAAGVALGVAFSKLIETVHDNRLVEITLTTILAHSAFLTAEHALHVSGVIATVSAGLTMGSYGRNKISPPVLEHMESFWEYFAFICNSLIFLLVGLSVDLGLFIENFSAVLLAATVVMAARAVGVYGLFPLIGRFSLAERVDRGVQTVVFWGGLRGALAIVMALSIPEELPERDFLLTLTLGVVVFSLLVNGLTIKRLMALLGLDRYSLKERYERAQARLMAKDRAMGLIESFSREEAIGRGPMEAARRGYGEGAALIRRDLEELESAVCSEDVSEVVLRHALMIEKRSYQRLFGQGLLSEDNLKGMLRLIERELDRVREGIMVFRARKPLFRARLASSIEGIPLLAPLVRRHKTFRIAAGYEMERARFVSCSTVIEELGNIGKHHTLPPEAVDRVRETYAGLRRKAADRLEAIRGQYPEYVEKADAGILKRYLLNVELECYREEYSKGAITEKVMSEMKEEIQGALRKMRFRPVRELFMPPSKLVGRVPCFSGLAEGELGRLTSRLKARSFLMGDVVVRQGEEGDSLFIIGRGEVDVTGREGQDLGRLGAGDFFGETALLYPQPRTATVRAATPCLLLELSRRAITPFFDQSPQLKETLEEAYRTRVLNTILADVPVLRPLDGAQRDRVAGLMRPSSYRDGAVIAEAGSRERALRIIREGEAEILVQGRRTATLRRGERFGEEGLLEGKPLGFTVRAIGRVEIYTLHFERLAELPGVVDTLAPPGEPV